ncbi:unnamed protein product [Closterium sp. NIES-54]
MTSTAGASNDRRTATTSAGIARCETSTPCDLASTCLHTVRRSNCALHACAGLANDATTSSNSEALACGEDSSSIGGDAAASSAAAYAAATDAAPCTVAAVDESPQVIAAPTPPLSTAASQSPDAVGAVGAAAECSADSRRPSSPRKAILDVLRGSPLHGERGALKRGWFRIVSFVRRENRQAREQKESESRTRQEKSAAAVRGGGEVTTIASIRTGGEALASESSANSRLTFGDWASGGGAASSSPGDPKARLVQASRKGESGAGCNGALRKGGGGALCAAFVPTMMCVNEGARSGERGARDWEPGGEEDGAVESGTGGGNDDTETSLSFHVRGDGGGDEQAEGADEGQAEVVSRGVEAEELGGPGWTHLARAALEPWEVCEGVGAVGTVGECGYSGDGVGGVGGCSGGGEAVLVYVPHVNPSPQPPTVLVTAALPRNAAHHGDASAFEATALAAATARGTGTASGGPAANATVRALVTAPSSPAAPAAARWSVPRTYSIGSFQRQLSGYVASPQRMFNRLPDDIRPRLHCGHEKWRSGSVDGIERGKGSEDGGACGCCNSGYGCELVGAGKGAEMREAAEEGCRAEKGENSSGRLDGSAGASSLCEEGNGHEKQAQRVPSMASVPSIPTMPSPRTAASVIRNARRITAPALAYERSFLTATHGKGPI